MALLTTDDVYELMGAHLPSAALNAALELGLFWWLADRPQTVGVISQELGIPPRRCNYWLLLLTALGLLERDGDFYSLTPTCRRAIVGVHEEGTWKMLAIDAFDNYAEGVSLSRRLVETGSQGEAPRDEHGHLPGYVRAIAEDLERARLFARMLYELHRPLAQAIADALNLEGAQRLLDVGGGSAVVSYALLRKYPALSSLVVDIANTCIAGQEIAASAPERDRLSYYSADFTLDLLPTGFDVVLACDIGEFDETLLAKLAGSVGAGGHLVLVDRWFANGDEIASRVAYLLRRSLTEPDFSVRCIEEIQSNLMQLGLDVAPVVELPYQKWKMIQATKGIAEEMTQPAAERRKRRH